MPSDRVRPRIPETSDAQKRSAQAWNKGMVGQGRPAVERPAFEPCPVDACMTPVIGRRPPAPGMVQVSGSADGAAAHWYCPGRCAAIARARAELRAIPMRQGGVR